MGEGRAAPVRTLVVWCLDWPVVALRRHPSGPVAVVAANRVVAASLQAREAGVHRGLRRREAQGRCPALEVLERDLAAEARAFEAVARALDDITPRVELTRPGLGAFPTRGPARYFGGDEALAEQVLRTVAPLLGSDRLLRSGRVGQDEPGPGACRVGIADGPFAAALAARAAPDGGYQVIPPGQTPAFLAPLPVTALDQPELTDVFLRLGLATLGALAALPAAAVLGRFGAAGERAHRLARGDDDQQPATTNPPPDLAAVAELDPPLERVDQAAFVGKALADDLLARLERRGATTTRILVAAETEHGEELVRCWRHEGTLTAGAVADRIRWQLDGWLNQARGPTGGLTRLSVRPDDLVPAKGRQLGFWGEQTEATERAGRAVARLQGLLGPDAVLVPERRGGRSPGEQVVLVPATGVELARSSIDAAAVAGPWPGALPAPLPTRLADAVLGSAPVAPVALFDATGELVGVSGRGLVSAAPAGLVLGGTNRAVLAWAGPWPVEERWWDRRRRRRQARFQVLTDDGVARLLVLEGGRWSVAATYD